MRARVVVRFKDLVANEQREVGDVFTCTPERFKELAAKKFVKADEIKPDAKKGK